MTPVVPHPIPRGTVRRSLRTSLWDGVFASLTLGLSESFFVPFALALMASPSDVAWLAASAGLLAAVSQWWTAHLINRFGGRRRVLAGAVWAQCLLLFALASVPLWPEGTRVTGLILFAALYAGFGGLSAPLWNSLMAKYLPPHKRAGYFGWRGRLMGAIVIGAGFAAGGTLNAFGKGASVGFSVLFIAAALCRLVSAILVTRYFEPPVSVRIQPRASFRQFRWSTKRAPFWPFVAAAAAMTFAANLSGPFFAVYMLQGLHFSYLTYTVLNQSVNVATLMMVAVWGRKADEAGVQKIFRVACWGTLLPPVLWLLGDAPVYVFFVQLAGGLVWSGFNLCMTNYIFDAVPPRLRVQAISYLNVANGLALFAGAFVGGHLLEILPPFLGFPFLTLVAISGVLRGAVCLFILPRVPPVRRHRDVSSWDIFFSVVGVKPVIGVSRDLARFLLRFE